MAARTIVILRSGTHGIGRLGDPNADASLRRCSPQNRIGYNSRHMATFTQLPGTLDISMIQGDEIEVDLDFDRDLTGYTFSNSIYVEAVLSGGGGGGFVSTVGSVATSFAISIVNLSTGRINIGLSEIQTAALSPSINYRWFLRWVAPGLVTRTVLSGTMTVSAP